MAIHETPVDLSGYSQKDLDFIRAEAAKRRCSFDEAMKQIMLERIRVMRKRPIRQALAELFGFPTVH